MRRARFPARPAIFPGRAVEALHGRIREPRDRTGRVDGAAQVLGEAVGPAETSYAAAPPHRQPRVAQQKIDEQRLGLVGLVGVITCLRERVAY